MSGSVIDRRRRPRGSAARPLFRGLLGVAYAAGVAACGSGVEPSYRLSHHPADTVSRPLRHYPVARQGDLTAWLASDHVLPSGKWLYAPDDPTTRYRIVGIIRAKDMPQATKHDGAFLLAEGYDGPLFDLWRGEEGEGRLFDGSGKWIRARLHQDDAVNTWVAVPRPHKIGGWSGYPVVIGDPARPSAVAGAMWYRRNDDHRIGGATSTRMLAGELEWLRFADFVKSRRVVRKTQSGGLKPKRWLQGVWLLDEGRWTPTDMPALVSRPNFAGERFLDLRDRLVELNDGCRSRRVRFRQ